jgi:hypothetical protein
MARLRDGQMTTRSGPAFAVKVPPEPSQTVANCAVSIIDAVGTVPGIGLGGQPNLHASHQQGATSPGVTSLTEVFGGMRLIRDDGLMPFRSRLPSDITLPENRPSLG